ncbi:class I SAM-dependent methyltransferase [Aliterella atlantica]|uniref:Methyltransferase type 12 n=1 Tax=Aliterella atlantica CENA595 TaxID=1618023 RepID=A0A0D8ZTQ9_9CYAN|nr:class I SAM-dependent methyltransferase [Aliterella atlantica]KJH71844.1 hypothetical protein UH38_10725 [Aliterella atlantica CENA595]
MLNIDNNFTFKCCPVCTQDTTYKVGNINYSSPIYFSSQEILVNMQPALWRCKSCKSGFVQNIIPEEIATYLYTNSSADKRWSSSKFTESKCQEVIKALNAIFHSGSSVLDIGCNTGELLDYAKEKNCKTFGVEYSLTSRNVLKSKGHTAYGDLLEANDCYDIITAFDLIEHLYDLPSFLEVCHEKLNNNGYLVFLTGNINSISSLITNSKWWYVSYPEHIIFPSKHYFKSNPKFKLQAWIPTYASKYFKRSWLFFIERFTKSCLLNRYNGFPSIGKDHILIILKKCLFDN